MAEDQAHMLTWLGIQFMIGFTPVTAQKLRGLQPQAHAAGAHWHPHMRGEEDSSDPLSTSLEPPVPSAGKERVLHECPGWDAHHDMNRRADATTSKCRTS